ncbi:hypothetical protein ACN28S_50660 [Cystobacter fuscus]
MSSRRVMATSVVCSSTMVTPEAEPWKSRVSEASKAWARKERWAPTGMLPTTPPHTPLVEPSSTVMERKSEALMVTVTRETEAESAWDTEAANWTEPALEDGGEQLVSSTRHIANSTWGEAFCMDFSAVGGQRGKKGARALLGALCSGTPILGGPPRAAWG